MATTKRLERILDHAIVLARKASGALAKNLLVTRDLTADAEGFAVKQVAALADKPFGVCDDAWADGKVASVIRANAVVPIVCADATVAAGVLVYNDAAGKVSATQGAGASLVGTTMSKTSAAGELVSVDLANLP